MSEQTIVINEDGSLQFVWSDELVELAEQGEAHIVRASHVEPHGTGWTADMRPVNGPIVFADGQTFGLDGEENYPPLKPFRTRAEALAAERKWLADHMGL
jgi:hypothetical protein